MVRTYKRKKEGPKWKEEDMANAMSDVVDNKMSIYQAAKSNGVPETTLRHRVMSKTLLKQGKPTVLAPIVKKRR